MFIEPGSPWEKAYGGSFNGKLRDELLDREIFYTWNKPRRAWSAGGRSTTRSGHTAREGTDRPLRRGSFRCRRVPPHTVATAQGLAKGLVQELGGVGLSRR